MLRRYACARLNNIIKSKVHIQCRPYVQPTRPLYRRARTAPYQEYFQEYREDFGPTRTTRFLRSSAWILLFGTIGFGAGQYYELWFYQKSGKIVPDSELDATLTLDIMKQIDESPMVKAIKADSSFAEVWPLAIPAENMKEFGQRNNMESKQHLIYTALRGTRGVFPRAFYCESRGVLCMVIGFGNGVEGHEYQVHGGIISTMVHEGMRVLAHAWFPDDSDWHLSQLDVNFKKAISARSICCITIMPAATVKDVELVLSDPKKYGHWPEWTGSKVFSERVNIFMAYLSQSDGHPLYDVAIPLGHAAGKFRVEGGDWPPASPSQLDVEEKGSLKVAD